MADEEHPEHPESDAIGWVSHYYSQLSVAAVTLEAPLTVGNRIHIKGHTTDVVQPVESLQVDHRPVERAIPGDDVALKVIDHVRERDKIYLEA